ncbi:hypothetical protein KM043_001583 [Ampulex compressa]|nr:hypothetical protein KM043_001583 [Ampulex compressa]
MLRSAASKLPNTWIRHDRTIHGRTFDTTRKERVPDRADVVIIGGGSAGCNALYHLGKNGIDAILLDKSKLISGTTWHTAGLVWSARAPYDVDMELLKVSKRVLGSLEKETGVNPGWINNGGLYIAHTRERLAEYKRVITACKALNVEARELTPVKAREIFPLLNEKNLRGAIYAPEDGVVDPAMLINALTKSAKDNGCKVFEDCPVKKILARENGYGGKRIYGVETPYGTIKTKVVLNACGAWSRNVAKMVGLDIPLVPMKHAYIVTEPIKGTENLPNIRDPDIGLYFRVQGGSISIGGYEPNPIILRTAPEDFSFSLYELDWDVFNKHAEAMVELIPQLSATGVRSTVCGPESFTPDHRPIMGEDPRCMGLYYSCGYNSAGMMLGGGCGLQIAQWIIDGRPEFHMFNYDIRRFIPEQRITPSWSNERSHEAYAKNYSIVFPYDEALSGRNFKTDPFHDLLVKEGAVMEERQGWERPGWFLLDKTVNLLPYDYYGCYDLPRNEKDEYRALIEADNTFSISPYDRIIREEALCCRNNVALFDVSYFGKFYLCGPEAQRAADHLFTAETNRDFNKTVYTCMLNDRGGVEADCTVTATEPGSGGIVDPIFKDKAFYIVVGGMSAYQAWSHVNKVIAEGAFDVSLHDVTEQIGVLSVQGPNSRRMLEDLIEEDLSERSLPFSTTKLARVKGERVRIIRLSFVGELGFELHIPKASCVKVYELLRECGKLYGMRLAGYRALYSLSCEKGYHLWGADLRTDDNPVEAGLGFACRREGEYIGKAAVDRLRESGMKKRLVHFYSDTDTPMWGMEAIYRDDRLVGYLRRAERGYSLGAIVGHGYVQHPEGRNVTKEFLETGNYRLEVMGDMQPTTLRLRSAFDPQNKRLQGIYDQENCPY